MRDRNLTSIQYKFDLFDESTIHHSALVNNAIEALANSGGPEARGAVFTRLEVVDFILDLAGYTEDRPLHEKRLLEPSFGGGDFLLAIVRRLLTAWRVAKGVAGAALEDLGDSIRAVELHNDTFTATHSAVVALLVHEGLSANTATALANRWLLRGDFLLIPLDGQFDFVIGNPPYVRQESIPAPLLAVYRARYGTIYDRADIYIPFIERSLSLLSAGGCLGFICADRWMKNRYGGQLRGLVAEVGEEDALIDVGGVGYVVRCGGKTLSRLPAPGGRPIALALPQRSARPDRRRLRHRTRSPHPHPGHACGQPTRRPRHPHQLHL